MLEGVVNRYVIRGPLGKGRSGSTVYRAESVMRSRDEPAVALKYPAGRDELHTLRSLERGQERGSPCLGVPRLLGADYHKDEPFVATPLLGAPLSDLFDRIMDYELEGRWKVVQLVGRMLLRRLEALHQRGFVHGDVAPDNFLFGETEGGGMGLWLVDFGCARPFPNGKPVMAYWGTVEFTPMRMVDNVVRQPYDDLESLGYVLCHGLFGELPWFRLTREQTEWEGKGRDEVCEKVRGEKASVLWGQWAQFGFEYMHLTQMPMQLTRFLLGCAVRKDGKSGLPQYDTLATLLGADGTSEEDDQLALKELVEGLKVRHEPPT